MPAADEFTGPVGYSSLWVWLSILAVIALGLWFLGVWAWSISGHPKPPPPRDPARARGEALGELDRIGHRVATGELGEREGYQQMSGVVRGFVAEATGLPTHTMALADLRALGIEPVAETIALMYPPEFAPEDDAAPEPLADTLARARNVVATWN
ncbi:hypothetical protein [Nocardioides sp. AE5]|uniref:hypothetical protein n=1 Tax=Nocardioides sp. AE5 TaxID=2962573 RepID=UPI0028816703|nr:hypothetical protein [Nocardioides sp. AE5]MDT0201112.1 hypothetical protein [Nocardioides sp. AE5]